MEVKEVIQKLGKQRKDIVDLRNIVNALNKDKEETFAKKKEISTRIKQLFGEIRELKKKRDALNSEIRELKKKRDPLNLQIKELSQVIRESKSLLNQDGNAEQPKINPRLTQKKISQIEFKLETEVMPFNQESQLRRVIKDLKKELEEAKKQSKEFFDIIEMNNKLREIKAEADKHHRQIQQKAMETKEIHDNIISNAKEIESLKEQENALNEEASVKKKDFLEKSNQLKDMLKQTGSLSKQLNQIKEDTKAEEKKKTAVDIEKKKKQIEEKMKKGQKLTTEDLLVFQSGGPDDDSEAENDDAKEQEDKKKNKGKAAKKEPKQKKEEPKPKPEAKKAPEEPEEKQAEGTEPEEKEEIPAETEEKQN
ncbi:MAG TPA: hypothetical protein ENN46_02945 [Candidatus Woesearchaeota archaeon]|nr:hypothetical protein [Candidatus Woesearchaeota archaeon]